MSNYLLSEVLASFCVAGPNQLFEGPQTRMRPVFKQSLASSSVLTTVGKIIGHSIILDGKGFPYLSPAYYYLMAGHPDRALGCLGSEDAGERLQRVISTVAKLGIWYIEVSSTFLWLPISLNVLMIGLAIVHARALSS